jgi:hypothetical protein
MPIDTKQRLKRRKSYIKHRASLCILPCPVLISVSNNQTCREIRHDSEIFTARNSSISSLGENDVEEDSTSPSSGQLTSSEQNLYQHCSPRLNQIQAARSSTVSAAAKSNSITTDPIISNISSDENDNEVQCAFNASKYETTTFHNTLPFIIDENMMLANILERNSNDEQNIILQSNGIYFTFDLKKKLLFLFFI